MKHTNNLFLLILCILCMNLSFISCKKTAREIAEKTVKESSEEIAEESSERGILSLSKNALKKLDWEDLFKLIKENNINIAEQISKLSPDVQRQLVKAFQDDPDFMKSVLSSSSLLDEYAIYTKEAPKLLTNIDFLRTFAKSDYLARKTGKSSFFADLLVKEDGGTINIFSKGSTDKIATYKDGLVTLIAPFKWKTHILSEQSLLHQRLIPNSVYKIREPYGRTYLYNVDNLGRISSVRAQNISPNEVISNIISFDNNTNYGKEWSKAFAKVKQTSKGNDLTIEYNIIYKGDDVTPSFSNIKISTDRKKILSQSYKNLERTKKLAFSAKENAKIVKSIANKLGISQEKETKLLQEMADDEELAKLIHENPEFNISRWLNSHNHVNQKLIKRTPKGQLPKNARVYAGNVYYFNPALNPGLKARLTRGNGTVTLKQKVIFTYDELVKLDKMYPEGVPFTKEGFPDFSKVAAKDKNGKAIVIDIRTLSGDSKKDISKAETLFEAAGNKHVDGYTWHHIENSTSLLRVPTVIHQLVDHSGGISMSRKL